MPEHLLEESVAIFLIIMAVVLISPLLIERIQLPGIVGLILGGILVGPNVSGLLEVGTSIVNFSVSLDSNLSDVEEEVAQLLNEGYEIAVATGYSTGQSGPHHGGAFVFLVKRDEPVDQ